MAEIRIENLSKRFGAFTAVQDSSFTVADGEFLALLGPSGCGKTTTLRMIAGLELPTGGKILLDGEDVTMNRARERDIAFVFQLFALYPHMNVRKNIGFPLLSQGVPKGEIRSRVEETARLLRIGHILDKSVSGLAGGDRQRVALGRAIVRRPKCFLMDEPLGTLDAEFREVMVHELRELHNRIHATTVYVTHDQHEAMAMADKIAVMNHGVIEQFGSPQEIYQRPASMYVADFIGSPPMNFLKFHSGLRRGATRSRSAKPRSDWPMSIRIVNPANWPWAFAPSTSASRKTRACAAASTAASTLGRTRSSRSIPRMAGSRRGWRHIWIFGSANRSGLSSMRGTWRSSTQDQARRLR